MKTPYRTPNVAIFALLGMALSALPFDASAHDSVVGAGAPPVSAARARLEAQQIQQVLMFRWKLGGIGFGVDTGVVVERVVDGFNNTPACDERARTEEVARSDRLEPLFGINAEGKLEMLPHFYCRKATVDDLAHLSRLYDK